MEQQLNTKKAILEYIEIARKEAKQGEGEQVIADKYQLIYDSIDQMSGKVKPNTIAYLKKQLKDALGKYDVTLEEEEEDTFIEFFKDAYPEGKRRKSFTWVLTDPDSISQEQILTTLKYINKLCLKGYILSEQEKKDIFRYIEKVLDKREIKNINQIRSLEGIRKITHIQIVGTQYGFEIK